MTIYLTPLRDLTLEVAPKHTNPTTGAREPITSGTLTAFLATSNAPSATQVGSLTTEGVHVGSGRWIVSFNAAMLTEVALSSLTSTPFCILQMTDEFRDYVTLTYRASAPATIP